MNQPHDPLRQVNYLQQCLSNDKKPLGLFLGAGCPVAVKSGDGKPLIPATRDTRAVADAEAFSDSDNGTKKKPEGRGLALAFNDLLTGEPDTISGAASGGMRSARAARPPLGRAG